MLNLIGYFGTYVWLWKKEYYFSQTLFANLQILLNFFRTICRVRLSSPIEESLQWDINYCILWRVEYRPTSGKQKRKTEVMGFIVTSKAMMQAKNFGLRGWLRFLSGFSGWNLSLVKKRISVKLWEQLDDKNFNLGWNFIQVWVTQASSKLTRINSFAHIR